jgi:hypothetical protein
LGFAWFDDNHRDDQSMNDGWNRVIAWGEDFAPPYAMKRQVGQTDPKNLSQRYHPFGETVLSRPRIQEQK